MGKQSCRRSPCSCVQKSVTTDTSVWKEVNTPSNNFYTKLYWTTSSLKSNLYHVRETTRRGVRTDRHCLTNKKTRLALIPEVIYWAAAAKLCGSKLFSERQGTHVHVQCNRKRNFWTETQKYGKTKTVTFRFPLTAKCHWTVCQ